MPGTVLPDVVTTLREGRSDLSKPHAELQTKASSPNSKSHALPTILEPVLCPLSRGPLLQRWLLPSQNWSPTAMASRGLPANGQPITPTLLSSAEGKRCVLERQRHSILLSPLLAFATVHLKTMDILWSQVLSSLPSA